MKTILFTFALPLALCAAHGTSAQTKSMMSAPKADTVMLSEMTDGDYLVRRYVVKSNADKGYSLYYKISTTKLVPEFDSNAKALGGLDEFMMSFDKDSLMHVEAIKIIGYASPDGPQALNLKLAQGRAESLKDYADKKFGLSTRYKVSTGSVAQDWMAARASIANSDVPRKQEVLALIDKKEPAAVTERKLKAMPGVWKYLAEKVLPPMRYSEIAIMYGKGSLYEHRTIIPKPMPEPEPEPCVDPCECVDVYEAVSGLIIEMDDVDVDFQETFVGEVHKAEKVARKEARIAEKLARKEAKDAAKIARKTEKEARKMGKAAVKDNPVKMAKTEVKDAGKIARKTDKETRKMAEAEAKAAGKSYKKLEKLD